MASLQPFTGILGQRRAAHLLRRTSYVYSASKVNQMANQTAAQALSSLLVPYSLAAEQPVYDDPTTTTNEAATWVLPLPGTDNASLPAQDFVLRRYVIAGGRTKPCETPVSFTK